MAVRICRPSAQKYPLLSSYLFSDYEIYASRKQIDHSFPQDSLENIYKHRVAVDTTEWNGTIDLEG